MWREEDDVKIPKKDRLAGRIMLCTVGFFASVGLIQLILAIDHFVTR